MNLKVLLPSMVFIEKVDVSLIVVHTPNGFFGLLPHRLDCVTAIAPGVLMYATPAEGKVYLAVDIGVMTKTGQDVQVSVRHAIGGSDLGQLQEAVTHQFLALDDVERAARDATIKMEGSFLGRFAELQNV